VKRHETVDNGSRNCNFYGYLKLRRKRKCKRRPMKQQNRTRNMDLGN
jgi:hypothetical protein